jgi:hypothetical protein
MSRFAHLSTFAAIPFFAASALAQITFDDWRDVVFDPGELADPAISGPNADFDGDGVNTLHEFVFASDPFITEQQIRPRPELVSGHLALTFRERHEITGVDVRLQGSATLNHWVTYNSVTEADRELFTGFDEVTWIDPVPLGPPSARRFVRLRVSLDDPQTLRAPERGGIDVVSPHVWNILWTDPNTVETGHAVERLRGLHTWERLGTAGPDLSGWTHSLANYAESFTYRVLAQGDGGAEVASPPFSLLDTDGDGIPDIFELGSSYFGQAGYYGSYPNQYSSNGSGLPDGWLAANGFDPAAPFDGSLDSDGDGLSDAEEYARGTDPHSTDTDGDGMPDAEDGWPLQAWIINPALPETKYVMVPLSALGWPSTPAPTALDDVGGVFGRHSWGTSVYLSSRDEQLHSSPSDFDGTHLSRTGLVAGRKTLINLVDHTLVSYSHTVHAAAIWNPTEGLTVLGPVPEQPDKPDPENPPAHYDLTYFADVKIAGINKQGAVAAWHFSHLWTFAPWMVDPPFTDQPYGGWAPNQISGRANALIYSPEGSGQLMAVGGASGWSDWLWGVFSPDPAPIIYSPVGINTQGTVVARRLQLISGVNYDWWNSADEGEGVFAVEGAEVRPVSPWSADGEALGITDGAPVVIFGRHWQEGGWWAHKESSGEWSGEPLIVRNNSDEGSPINITPRTINDRLEMITNGPPRLIRDGISRDLAELLPAGWQVSEAKDINNHSVILGTAKRTLAANGDPIPTAQQINEPVLVVPVELTLSHPLVTSPEPPEYVVNADVASVLLTASVLGAADGTLVGWEIETGDGTLSHAESATVDGFAQTTLTTSTQVGATYRVTARVKKLIMPAATPGGSAPEFDFEALGLAATEPTLRQTTDDITVIPGFAAAITVTRENEDGGTADPLTADGHSRRVLVASVRDAFGQPVAENTPVNWHLSGSGKLADIDEFTDAEGFARAVLVAGDAIDDQKIRIEADSFEITETVPNLAVTGTLVASTSSLDLAPGNATATLTLSVPEAMNGAPVRWFTSLGTMENPAATVSGGQATATLRASGGRVGAAIATASIGGAVYFTEVTFTSSAPITVEVEHPVIVGDASSDGTHPVPRADGTVENVAYRSSTPVHIRAPAYAGQTATVRFGKVKPAADLLYRFDQLSAGTTPSETGDHPATVSGATLDTTRRHEGAASLFFDGEDAVLGVPDHTAVRLQSGLVISLWVHAADSGGSLVAKAGEYDLSIDTEGRATFTVQTTSGPTTLVGTTFPLDAWTQVRAEYRAEGELRLSVGGTTMSATAPGQPQSGSALVLVGENFGGWLDRLAFEAGEQFIAGTGLDVIGVDLADQVVLDANGEATVTLAGNGGDVVNATNPVLGVGIRVSINPEITLNEGVLVTTRENYAVLDATLGDVRLSVNGGTELLSPERKAEILAACLLNLESTGQRAAAVPFVATGTAAERQQFGFRVALWMQQTGDGATNIKVVFQNTESLPLTAEQRHLFQENLTQMLQDAIRFRSDAAAEASLTERWEGFLGTLSGLSLGGDFPALVLAADNTELFNYFGELHEEYGPELIGELASLGQQEAVRNPRFIQRVVVGLKKVADVITGEWQQQVVTSTEGWLRDRTMQAFAEGKLDEVDAYYIGFAWGLCSEAFATGQLANQFAAQRMMNQLGSTVVAAWNGSQEARDALKTMIPVYGNAVMNDSTRALADQGQYFDAGMGSAQESTAAIGTVTGGGQLLKAGTVAIIVKGAGKKAAKGGPPRLPASFGKAITLNYRETFFKANPSMEGKVIVHHAVEQRVLTKYPGLVTPEEIHSLQNLRGIPKSINNEMHLRLIRIWWDGFYEKHPSPTKAQLLKHATEIDDALGDIFLPNIR